MTMTETEQEKCVATCMSASDPECDCRCGGSNHGIRAIDKLDGTIQDEVKTQLREKFMGKKVKSLRDFSGIPEGTVGMVYQVYGDKRHSGIMVRWTTTNGHEVNDGFGVDEEFDETTFLEVVR